MATETLTATQSHAVIRAIEQRVKDLERQMATGQPSLHWYIRGRADEARDQLANIRIALSEPDAQP
jgi:hypothetical protein